MLSSRTARFFAVAGLVAGAAGFTTARAQDFEGAVTVRLTPKGEHSQGPMDVTYLMRHGLTRVEFTVPGGMSMATILDVNARTMTSILPAQKMYMVTDYGADVDSMSKGKDNSKVTRTGKMETVAGRSCEHILVTDGDKQTDLCGTTGMGAFMGMGGRGRGPMGGMSGQPAWVQDLVKQGFFPLKMTSADMLWEVTKIEPKSLDASLFAPPAGYQKMDMGSMMRRPPRG